ncbi:MAG: DUF4493 domain-containing protein [Bacteroidales bacterium]|nr:DUF4493 domain-containing protein [Bacteroidales bacterium]
MKKIFLVLLAAVAAASCARQAQPEGVGTLSLKMSRNGEYQTKASGNSDVNEFVIDITRPSDGYVKHFDRFADMPQVLELGSGSYTITATSPVVAGAGWDLPIYSASADFVIKVGELTPISLTATLQNMKVTFDLSDNFCNELSDYTIAVTNAPSWENAVEGVNTLTWADKAAVDEGRPGYFGVAALMVKVDGYRNIDGGETHASLTITQVAPRDHHVIHLDAKVTGSVNGITITLDDSVNERDSDVDVDGWDETPVEGGDDSGDDEGGEEGGDNPPASSTAPTMSWESNANFDPVPITDPMDVEIIIEAQEKIAEFVVLVDSYILGETIAALAGMDYTYSADTPFVMDLINNEALIGALGAMIPTGDALLNQTHVDFSLSQLVPLILVYSPESGSNHVFTLQVTDTKGQTLEKPVTFYAL